MRLNIILAEDHTMFREGVRAFLEHEGISVIGEAANGRDAVELVAKLRPHVALLDLSMPVLNGIEATREIHARGLKTHTALLTMHEDVSYVVEALRAGVRGYVLKAQAATGLVECLREVARGETYLSPGLPRAVIQAYFNGEDLPEESLSSREQQVVRWIAQGKTTREIATLLELSPKTVESHRSRIMRKLDVHETAGLVRFAIRHHLAEP